MNVVKFIVGFIGGVVGLVSGSVALYFCFFRPLYMLTVDRYPEGSEAGTGLIVASIVTAIAAVCIGASYAPKIWKWGLTIGSVAPAALALLPFLAEWTINS